MTFSAFLPFLLKDRPRKTVTDVIFARRLSLFHLVEQTRDQDRAENSCNDCDICRRLDESQQCPGDTNTENSDLGILDRKVSERLTEYCDATGQSKTTAVERILLSGITEYFDQPEGHRVPK